MFDQPGATDSQSKGTVQTANKNPLSPISSTKSKQRKATTFGKVAGGVGTPLDRVNEDDVSQVTEQTTATGLPNNLTIEKMNSINENLKEELTAVIEQMDI